MVPASRSSLASWRPGGRFCLLFLCGLCASAGASFAAPPSWATYRGNAQRTGNIDNKAGPSKPSVLWVLKAKDHFITAPVPDGKNLFISGLGFANAPTMYALNNDPKAKTRTVWSKSLPTLSLPTVSSPAFSAGKMVFGDGMHQTNGAMLFALEPGTGELSWRLTVPGTLVHLEGAPTIVDDKVYIGGGAAGVLCVSMDQLKLDGKAIKPEAAKKARLAKRAELQKKYEEAKKKGDMFAMPPSDSDLPTPSPVVLWQQGKEKWHVDAPVTVADGKVLAASAFLDKEKAGKRALFCLDARTGKQQWEAPLAINPWGGASVSGDLVVVSGSTIAYDPREVSKAKGIIAAFDLKTGKPKWRKSIEKGGVLGCVALTKDLVIAAATDGKVRAYSHTGAIKWTRDVGSPIFAAPAVAGSSVYVGDLKGIVHSLSLKNGSVQWKLDLGTATEVKSPGMIYGGPVVQDGRVYVATCNIAGDQAGKPTAVVCIGEK